MKVRLATPALRDRRDLERHYEGSSALRGFREEFLRAIRYITMYPQGAPKARGEVRAKTMRRFPYSILYRITGDTVFVLAIVHHAQDADPFFGRD